MFLLRTASTIYRNAAAIGPKDTTTFKSPRRRLTYEGNLGRVGLRIISSRAPRKASVPTATFIKAEAGFDLSVSR